MSEDQKLREIEERKIAHVRMQLRHSPNALLFFDGLLDTIKRLTDNPDRFQEEIAKLKEELTHRYGDYFSAKEKKVTVLTDYNKRLEARAIQAEQERAEALSLLRQKDDELKRLNQLINTPETEDWMKAVPLEAAHQIERWGPEEDKDKTVLDWFWLIGYLAQKAVYAQLSGDAEKAKHHTISTAAVLLNWHRSVQAETQLEQKG